MILRKTAIVTGGAQGIGKAIALRLLKAGASVVIADLDREAGLETCRELNSKSRVKFIQCDTASERDIHRTVSATLRWKDGVDILINNAATMHGAPPEKLSLRAWNRVLAVNLTGPFLFARTCAPHLRRARGCIVNIASTRAFMSEPCTEAYSASKGGIVALTHSLAMSLAPDIRVNCISPGWIATSAWQKSANRKPPVLSQRDHLQHPAGRVGIPEDIAAMAIFLASAESGFITGSNIVIDGGMTRKMIYAE
jgi:NAD(P)-dependent dehydrogenase (short-subunit alcohol dehydrogenase family)